MGQKLTSDIPHQRDEFARSKGFLSWSDLKKRNRPSYGSDNGSFWGADEAFLKYYALQCCKATQTKIIDELGELPYDVGSAVFNVVGDDSNLVIL